MNRASEVHCKISDKNLWQEYSGNIWKMTQSTKDISLRHVPLTRKKFTGDTLLAWIVVKGCQFLPASIAGEPANVLTSKVKFFSPFEASFPFESGETEQTLRASPSISLEFGTFGSVDPLIPFFSLSLSESSVALIIVGDPQEGSSGSGQPLPLSSTRCFASDSDKGGELMVSSSTFRVTPAQLD